MYNLNFSKRFSFKFGELIVVQSKLYTYTYFEEKENSEVNAADHQDWDQELEESRESSVPSMRHMTQCKIEFTYASHCISKNLTSIKMLKKDLLIAK